MSDITHIVKSYEDELQSLNDNLIKMGSLVETQLSDSMEAIIKVDKEAAENIIKNDEKINELRATIEEQIVTVLVKRAPMAIDLRLTISTLKISSDLERIGDLAKSVAKKIIIMGGVARVRGSGTEVSGNFRKFSGNYPVNSRNVS